MSDPGAPAAEEGAMSGEEILSPPLPYRMGPRVERAVRDVRLRQFVENAAELKHRGRVNACRDAFGERYDAVRQLAGRIKQHTLDHLDHYLDRFTAAATAAGAVVHFALDGAEANRICLGLAQEQGCRLVVKSKSMVTEETRLLPALEGAGIETIETDLGEFIVQLDHDAPSHIVTPMIHKDRKAVARAFVRELGAEYTEDPRRLTIIAREHMRAKFRRAEMGISGANFLVAQTGSLVVCTNEGNADLAMGAPRVHVALVGIEKLVPRLEDLSVFLKLLARSATAQPLTVYTSIITGVRRAGEHDGPEELHIILVDNGRTELLREPTRELLRCIRCGACLNACPVYRKVGGGHAYGAVYSGPIGAVITPLMKGLENYADLPRASSLCGACFQACPVHIDIPSHLVRLRRELVSRRVEGLGKRVVMRAWAGGMRSGLMYRAGARVAKMVLRALGEGGAQGGMTDRRWITHSVGPLAGWTSERDLPTPARVSFREWWRRERGGRGGEGGVGRPRGGT
jgi:L-lactate dehydrogenase complex protein LldF